VAHEVAGRVALFGAPMVSQVRSAAFGGEVSCGWVAPAVRADGTSLVLKLGMPHMEGEHELQSCASGTEARLHDSLKPTTNLTPCSSNNANQERCCAHCRKLSRIWRSRGFAPALAVVITTACVSPAAYSSGVLESRNRERPCAVARITLVCEGGLSGSTENVGLSHSSPGWSSAS
jgi:hypothetical protein